MTTLVWLFFAMAFIFGWILGSKWTAIKYKRILKIISQDILELRSRRTDGADAQVKVF